jgi:hypothetical protein
MAHKIDFKTFDGSYGVYTTPKECEIIISKLNDIGFLCDWDYGERNSIFILPGKKEYCVFIHSHDTLMADEFITPKQLNTYLDKLLKEGSNNQPK